MRFQYRRYLIVLSLFVATAISGGLRFTDSDRQVFETYRQKIKRLRKRATLEDARLQIGFPYIRQVTKPFKGRPVEVWSFPTDEFTFSQLAFLDGKLETVSKAPAAGAIFVRGGDGLSTDDYERVKRFDDVRYGMKVTDVAALLGEPKERYDATHPMPEAVIRQFQANASAEDIAEFRKFMDDGGMAIWSYQVADVSLTITLENGDVTSVMEGVMPSEEQARLMRAQ